MVKEEAPYSDMNKAGIRELITKDEASGQLKKRLNFAKINEKTLTSKQVEESPTKSGTSLSDNLN